MVRNAIHITQATSEDAALITRLSRITFEETFTGTCTEADMESFLSTSFSLKNISAELHNEDDFYFIAWLENQAAGYMRLKEDYSEYDKIKKYKALELKRIYVQSVYQSKKIGAALMQYALQFAAKNNFEVIWLGVWEHNQKARSFYKKWGFEDTGDTHDFPIGNTPQTDKWMIKFIEKN